MNVSLEKHSFLSAQKAESAKLQNALNALDHAYERERTRILRLAKMKRYRYAIARSTLDELSDVSVWDHLNLLIERIHIFTWTKSVLTACDARYRRKRDALTLEAQDQRVQHRKERITLRYTSSWTRDRESADLS